MTIKDKILIFLEEINVKKAVFFLRTGIAPSNFKGVAMNSELGGDKIVKILTEFPNLSADWLLLGLGSMLRDDQNIPQCQEPIQPTLVTHSDSSSGETVVYYKIYKEKDAEVGVLKEEIGALKLKISQLEDGDPERKTTAKIASIKKLSSQKIGNVDSASAQQRKQ